MSTAVVSSNGTPKPLMQDGVVRSLDDAVRLAEIVHKSGLFPDVKTANQAVIKMLAGGEMGFGPFASLADVHIIEGKPSVGAHLKAAAIKRSGRYDYKVIRCDREACEVKFFEAVQGKWEPLGSISLTIKDAEASGWTTSRNGPKHNWKSTPDDMLFARVISKGYRRYCADLSSGVLSYDPDEMGDPLPVEVPVIENRPAETAQASAPAVVDGSLTGEQAARMDELVTKLGLTPERFSKRLIEMKFPGDWHTLTHSQAAHIINLLESKLSGKVGVK